MERRPDADGYSLLEPIDRAKNSSGVSQESASPQAGADKCPDLGREAYLRALEDEVSAAAAQESELREKLEEMQKSWDMRRQSLKTRLESTTLQKKKQQQDLKELLRPPKTTSEKRPGPECLNWVEGTNFLLVCSAVISANMITLVVELNHPHLAHSLVIWMLDQWFLAFYVTELILKGLLMHGGLFFGKPSEVWWHWLDAVIVVSGVMDQWLKPLAVQAQLVDVDADGGPSSLSFLRMLRLMRLARILKLVRVFLMSDQSWTEGYFFQSFIMCIIGINSLLMGFEADYPNFAGWYYIEQILLIIYSFELSVRLKHWGWEFFYHPKDMKWNIMDFTIVVGGVIDQWMLPCIMLVHTLLTGSTMENNKSMGQVIVLLRMARLLRVLRLVRLIKSVPPLFNLVTGIMEAMQGMTWVLLLTIVLLYAFAILATRLIGHGLLFGGEPPKEAEGVFPCVFESMFVLFKVMNGDQSRIAPLFHIMPALKVVFVLFMVASSWAILSILTAVVSENMISVTSRNDQENEEARIRMEDIRCMERLSELFSDLDKNGNGSLDEREFEKVIKDQYQADELCDVAGLGKHEIADLFDILSHKDKTGGGPRMIKYKDFIAGLQKEKDNVTMKSAMRIEKRLRDLGDSQDDMREQLQWMADRLYALEVHVSNEPSAAITPRSKRPVESSVQEGQPMDETSLPPPPPQLLSRGRSQAVLMGVNIRDALPRDPSEDFSSDRSRKRGRTTTSQPHTPGRHPSGRHRKLT